MNLASSAFGSPMRKAKKRGASSPSFRRLSGLSKPIESLQKSACWSSPQAARAQPLFSGLSELMAASSFGNDRQAIEIARGHF